MFVTLVLEMLGGLIIHQLHDVSTHNRDPRSPCGHACARRKPGRIGGTIANIVFVFDGCYSSKQKHSHNPFLRSGSWSRSAGWCIWSRPGSESGSSQFGSISSIIVWRIRIHTFSTHCPNLDRDPVNYTGCLLDSVFYAYSLVHFWDI